MLSNKREIGDTGFFKELHVQFREKLSDSDIKNFTNLSTDEERFVFVLSKHVKDKTLYDVKVDSDKDGSKALEYKEHGNKAFQQQSYIKAIYYYNKSLQSFPPESGQNVFQSIIH